MKKRERVLHATARKGPGELPCNFRAEKATINSLYDYVGYSDYDRLLDDLGVDIRYIDAVAPPEIDFGDCVQNFWGERYLYRPAKGGFYRLDIPGAMFDAKELSDFESFAWPTIDMLDYSSVKALCEKYDDYGIVYGFADIVTRPSIIRGFEMFLLDMYDNPEFVDFMVKVSADFYIEDYTKAQKECNGRIDIFLIMGDLASQIGPLFSIEMFDRYIGPHLKRMCDRIHELGAYAMFHSCGESFEFIDRLIKCGVDIVDPMQRTSEKMSPENLSVSFSERVCFHGGISVQKTLPYGTQDEVRSEVRRYIDAFKSSGGYICCSAHYMQHDNPPENIIAMYDEIKRNR